MTEICTEYPGEGSAKAVGPKDSYHEPAPGYWNNNTKEASNTGKVASANTVTTNVENNK